MNQQVVWFPIIAVPCFLFFFLVGLFWFHSYTGLGRDKTVLVLIASLIAGAFSSLHRARTMEPALSRSGNSEDQYHNAEIFLSVAAAGFLYPFAAALILRLWGRWIGGRATPAEREPGAAGIRAWFCASNVTVGALIVVCAWLAHDVSPLLGAIVIATLLAADPLLRMQTAAIAAAETGTSTPRVGEDLSAEREKIVSMLEAGKLTPEESAELLQALGESSRPAARPVPLTGSQRLMLIGAALVALGFFLPWFVINPGKELNRLTQQMQSSMSSFVGNPLPRAGYPPQAPGYSAGYPPQPAGYPAGFPPVAVNTTTGDITISGGDIQRGLGWATLALALAAALIPYVATALDTHTARTVRLLCLGLGALIVLYLLTQNLRFVGIGLIIAFAGYAVEIAGAIREHRSTAAA